VFPEWIINLGEWGPVDSEVEVTSARWAHAQTLNCGLVALVILTHTSTSPVAQLITISCAIINS